MKINKKDMDSLDVIISKWKTMNESERKIANNKIGIDGFSTIMNKIVKDY
jgi:hypothetical protein